MNSKICTILLLLAVTLCRPASAFELRPGSYTFDKSAKFSFSVVNFVVMTVDGEFPDFNCTIKIESVFDKSSVDCKVAVKSVTTGNEERDAHLKTEDFFSADKFPEILFKSDAIEGPPEKFSLKGKLTIRDIPKDVTFEVRAVPATAKSAEHFEATAKINRQEFDVKSGSTIKDTVRLKIEGSLVLK